MTKAELVAKIAANGEMSRTQAEKAVEGLVSAVSAALACGEKITIAGFGAYRVVSRPQRQVRGQVTGRKIKVAASNVVELKTGKLLSLRLSRNERKACDIDIINRRAEFVNREAREVLEYQAPL